jgi:hypothetical protein
MQIQLVALLLLASWTQQREDQKPHPVAARETLVVRVLVGNPRIEGNRIVGDRQVRPVTISIPAPPTDEDDEPRPARPPAGIQLNTAMVEPENFDRWLFGEESAARPERHLDEILLTRVRDAAREYDLNERQRRKLQLAGRGDIKRFFDRVEDRRRGFETERQRFQTGLAALKRLNDLSEIYQKGPFGDGSLFAKTLRKIQDDQKAGH